MPLLDSRHSPGVRRALLASALLCAGLACSLAPARIGAAGESYLGERVPGVTPRPFAARILSADRHPHSRITFSRDGLELCWSAFIEEGSRETIFCSRFDGKLLGKPDIASFLPDREGAGPAFSDDGLMVFFKTKRRLFGPRAVSGIAAVTRKRGGWSHPVILSSTFDSTRSAGQPTVARSGNLYFAGRRLKDRFPKIYSVRFVDGDYESPEPLPTSINSPGALDPFIDPDERFLLFVGLGRSDGQGITDLYISHRRVDGDWGEPVNLGAAVNTEHFERFPSLSRDGKYLFFIRCVGNRYPSEDLHYYWVDASILKQPSE
jgi:hypothetical protein